MMIAIKAVLFLCLLVSRLSAFEENGQSNKGEEINSNIPPEVGSSDTGPHSDATDPKPTTTGPEPTTTKPEPITTEPKPTTTEPKPTTTEPKPTTTEPSPTTIEPKPTTTIPKSTTEPVTTSTPPSGNPDKPAENEIEIRDPENNNTLCLKAKFALSFEVHYNDTEKEKKTANVNVPLLDENDELLIANCSRNSSLSVPLTWDFNSHKWNATLFFESNNNTYNLSGLSANFYNDPTIFPDFNDNKTVYLKFENKSIFGIPAHLGRAYQCNSEEAIIVQPNLLTLKVRHLKIQAFRFNSDDFDKGHELCSADEPASTLIPIIVGCVLAGLIVIVLVSYLLATRKFKKYNGYETL